MGAVNPTEIADTISNIGNTYSNSNMADSVNGKDEWNDISELNDQVKSSPQRQCVIICHIH